MITNYVPGAYVTHDQLHIRGGHQTTWLVDGIPVPNTNIATNIGPQFDPKDIDYMEVNRGSYGAEFGDRTYGVFNVVPRTGFERNNQAELVLSAGNFYQTNDSFSFGSHTERFAYYASVNGNRSNLGSATSHSQVVHDAANGYGGFGSFIFNVNPSNQLRLVTALRKDYYQIPYDPNFNDLESYAVRQQRPPRQRPRSRCADQCFLGSHLQFETSAHGLALFHRNSADYESAPNDYPTATTDHHTSTYAGGQVSFGANFNKNDLQVGFFGFHQNDNQRLGILFNCATNGDPQYSPPNCDPRELPPPFADSEPASGGLAAFFLDDKFKPFSWLTLSAGLRPTHFSGSSIRERHQPALRRNRHRPASALDLPRLLRPLLPGAAFAHRLRDSGAVLHDKRLHLHPAPRRARRRTSSSASPSPSADGRSTPTPSAPAPTISSTMTCIGESNLFFPLTIDKALIRGWELTLRSPRIAHRAQIHLAYSNQVAYGGGAITGGLTDFTTNLCDPDPGLCPLDHDQRNTLNIGADVSLPWRSYASTNVYYGSGFSNAFPDQPYPGGYLPGHTTFDLSLGKDFGERVSASLNALNVANRRVELDNSTTFGGFHWNNPREIFVETALPVPLLRRSACKDGAGWPLQCPRRRRVMVGGFLVSEKFYKWAA